MEKTSLVRRFSIKGWGPIEGEFTFPFRPGVGILLGDQGVGKSSALEGIHAFMGGKFRVTANDIIGKAEIGVVDGATMKYAAKRVFTKGSAPSDFCVFVEDTGQLNDFVDPKEDAEVAADKRRMKWILRMYRAQVEFSQFEALIPPHGTYDPISIAAAKKLTDLVDQAGSVKRAFETEKRRIEQLQKDEQSKVDALTAAIEGVDLKAPCDHAELQAAHTEAVGEFSRLDEQRKAAEQVKVARENAASQLSASKSSYSGPSVADARKQVDITWNCLDVAKTEVNRLESLLKEAKSAVIVAQAQKQTAEAILVAAERHDRAISEMTGLLEGELPQPPEPEDLEGAKLAMDEARAALDVAVLVRDAKDKAARAKTHKEQAAKHGKYAGQLLDAAKSVEEVLSRSLNVPDIKVMGKADGLRLVYTGEGKEELLCRLSAGELILIGIKIIANSTSTQSGDGTRLATLAQEFWGELTDTSKAWVHKCALDFDTALVTAEAKEGPLRYQYFGEDDTWTAE